MRLLRRTEQLVDAAAGDAAAFEPEHDFEAPVAAHQQVAAQVGDARCRAFENRRQLVQQLLAARLRLLLLGDVERHDRRGSLTRRERGRLDPRHQPALAELGVAHRVAHLRALRVSQCVLQPFVFGQRLGRHDVAADRLQHRRPARRIAPAGRRALALSDPARRLLKRRQADAGGVHQRADLHLREVALFFDAAVFDDRHEAALATRRFVAANNRSQSTQAGIGLRQPALRDHRSAARLQLCRRRAVAPEQQLLQRGRRVRQQRRHRTGHRFERRVGPHQQAGLVVQHHAERAQVEPVVELAH